MSRGKKHNRSIIVRSLVIGISVYMIITLATLWKELDEKHAEFTALEQQKALKEAQIDELKYILEEGSQTALIEKAARERLGYEYSDAIVYIDESGN
ncbi:MAG: hypothetical protein E7562_00575 [Ruminococcaceae bacterium]|nr:hypothetical protein [Oscillospiraceae bacterium]